MTQSNDAAGKEAPDQAVPDAAQPAGGDGGYLTLALAAAALALSGFTFYKVWNMSATDRTETSCYRTIDMSILTKALIGDMLEKTADVKAEQASSTYRAKLEAIDAEVLKRAGTCLLIRRDATIMPDAAKDITDDVAKSLDLDLEKAKKADAKPAPAAAAATASANAIPNELGSKLD